LIENRYLEGGEGEKFNLRTVTIKVVTLPERDNGKTDEPKRP
jgi:hypothetical protein